MRNIVLRGLLAATLIIYPGGAEARASSSPLSVPAPSGPHPVGATTLQLVDASRIDPWVPSAGPRRLMVSLWYPALRAGWKRAQYMTPQESALLLQGQGVKGVPSDVLSTAQTDAFVDAVPYGRPRGLPLVVLSPGFSLPRSSLTSLGEELASRGYVVAAIDHTYETFGTTFPDGHTTQCVPCEFDRTPELSRKVTEGRAADVSFVLDRLTGPPPAWKGASLIDASRIAIAGHSIGGDSAVTTLLTDPRVRAGADLDGTINSVIPPTGLSRPFLLLGTEQVHTPASTTDTTWKSVWPRLTGWKRWITVTGAQHSSFTDLHALADQLGLDSGAGISGSRAVTITRAYVGAFVDLHLKHRSEPLLNEPSPRYPEVRFWN